MSVTEDVRPRFSAQLLADVEGKLTDGHSLGYLQVHALVGAWSPYTIRNVLIELERQKRVQSRLAIGIRTATRRLYRRASP